MPTKTKTTRKSFTPEQRAAYREAQTAEAQAKLEAALTTMQSSEGFQNWLTMRARFHAYSFQNTMLLLAQNPDATLINSAKRWNSLGRLVIKGERALRVFAPIEMWIACDQSEKGARFNAERKRWERKMLRFKLVPVFDVAQTHGDDLPDPPTPAELEGDSHKHLLAPLKKLAKAEGYKVKVIDTGDAGGWCDYAKKEIAISKGMSPNGHVRVLVHELAHAFGVDYQTYGRGLAEVIVESVTYIVLAGQGFDTDPASVPYVAGWAGREDAAEKVQEFASTIDQIARKIEAAL